MAYLYSNPIYIQRLRENKAEIWALMSYYSFPIDAPQSVDKLLNTINTVRPFVDHIVVVNDGGSLTQEKIPKDIKFIQINTHIGKAAAFREGYRYIVGKSNNPKDLIIQTDTDFDQNPSDVSLFIQKYSELISRKYKKILILGDRYHNIPENRIRFRQDILAINRALTRKFNYFDIADIQTGFRAYSLNLAQDFLNCGDSYRYGLEAEQTIIALKNSAKIFNVYLSASRLRFASTDPDKWIENTNAILDHSFEFINSKNSDLFNYFSAIEKVNEAMSKRQDVCVNIDGTKYYFYQNEPQKYTVVSLNSLLK